MDISGRSVLIVGGTSGIGLGLAQRFAAAGSAVVVGGRSTARVDVNLLGTIRVLDAFTPHLLGRGSGDLITVTSGIGFLPFPIMATYAASKAAVHAYSEALRAQLAGTGVDVTELVPPAVATPGNEDRNPAALEFGAYLDEVIALLSQTPTPREILVEGVKMHRFAERDGTYDGLGARRSQALSHRLAAEDSSRGSCGAARYACLPRDATGTARRPRDDCATPRLPRERGACPHDTEVRRGGPPRSGPCCGTPAP